MKIFVADLSMTEFIKEKKLELEIIRGLLYFVTRTIKPEDRCSVVADH